MRGFKLKERFPRLTRALGQRATVLRPVGRVGGVAAGALSQADRTAAQAGGSFLEGSLNEQCADSQSLV